MINEDISLASVHKPEIQQTILRHLILLIAVYFRDSLYMNKTKLILELISYLLSGIERLKIIENFYSILCRNFLPASPQRREISTARFWDRLYRVYDARRINFKRGRKFETVRPTNQPTIGNSPSLARCNQFCTGTSDHRLLVRTALVRGNLDLDYLQRILQSTAYDVRTCARASSYPLKSSSNPAESYVKISCEHRSYLLSFARA